MTYYRWDDREFETGEDIPRGRFGHILIDHGPVHTLWDREMLLETVRLGGHRSRPSRLSGLFAFVEIDVARRHVHAFASRPGIHWLYEVNVSPGARLFRGHEPNLAAVGKALRGRDFRGAVTLAGTYWREESAAPTDELVSSEPLRVIAVVDRHLVEE
ncbi:MAG TPA: hypothetical protein VFP83_02110 [Candidatus Limnocylindria bacterium]|nr:hypothetical protein [Candidatus Limnocylindria bacterium]